MDWLAECEVERAALPLEKQQEFMDYIWSGMTLGDSREKAGISFNAANGIMAHNIKKREFTYLNLEAAP